jgi:cell shape-determining protein MreC
MYSSYIMMNFATYVYLRDQSANNFRSVKLQEKRQKLQLTAMNKKLAQYENTYQRMKELSAKLGNSDQENGKHKPKHPCAGSVIRPGFTPKGKSSVCGRTSRMWKLRPKHWTG